MRTSAGEAIVSFASIRYDVAGTRRMESTDAIASTTSG